MKKMGRSWTACLLAAALLTGNVSAGAAETKTPPGFLEGFTPPEAREERKEDDLFTLFDQSAGESLTLSADELLPAALACEMDLSAPREALKAQATACYTLFCRRRMNREEIPCNSAEWQTWTTEEEMRARWREDYEANIALLREIAQETAGEILCWQGTPILAAYCAINAGITETAGHIWAQELSYLTAVASPGDRLSDGYLHSLRIAPEEFRRLAEEAFPGGGLTLTGEPESWLQITERSPAGYVQRGLLGGRTVTGVRLRTAFGLRSTCFTVKWDGEAFLFTTRGWGHGVGMSQAGAVFLAGQGMNHEEILAYYYPGAELTTGE